jgi:hypothetical protein
MSFKKMTAGSVARVAELNENYGVIAAQTITNTLNMTKIWDEALLNVQGTDTWRYNEPDNIYLETIRTISKIPTGSNSLSFNGLGTFLKLISGTLIATHGIDNCYSSSIDGSIWRPSAGSPSVYTDGSGIIMTVAAAFIATDGSGTFSGISFSGNSTSSHIRMNTTTMGAGSSHMIFYMAGVGSNTGVLVGSFYTNATVMTDIFLYNGSSPPTADWYAQSLGGGALGSKINVDISAANEQHLVVYRNAGNSSHKLRYALLWTSGNTSGIPIYSTTQNTGSLMRYTAGWAHGSGLTVQDMEVSLDGGSNFTTGAYKNLIEPGVSGTSLQIKNKFIVPYDEEKLVQQNDNAGKTAGWGVLYY